MEKKYCVHNEYDSLQPDFCNWSNGVRNVTIFTRAKRIAGTILTFLSCLETWKLKSQLNIYDASVILIS